MNKFNLNDRFRLFAFNTNKLCKPLFFNEHSKIFAKQLSRSSLSTSLNYSESRAAESRKDLLHKLRLVLKELYESHTCLNLIKDLNFIYGKEVENIIKEITS